MIMILEENDFIYNNDIFHLIDISRHLHEPFLMANIVLQETGNNEFKILKSRYKFADTCDILKNIFSKCEFYE